MTLHKQIALFTALFQPFLCMGMKPTHSRLTPEEIYAVTCTPSWEKLPFPQEYRKNLMELSLKKIAEKRAQIKGEKLEEETVELEKKTLVLKTGNKKLVAEENTVDIEIKVQKKELNQQQMREEAMAIFLRQKEYTPPSLLPSFEQMQIALQETIAEFEIKKQASPEFNGIDDFYDFLKTYATIVHATNNGAFHEKLHTILFQPPNNKYIFIFCPCTNLLEIFYDNTELLTPFLSERKKCDIAFPPQPKTSVLRQKLNARRQLMRQERIQTEHKLKNKNTNTTEKTFFLISKQDIEEM